MTSEEDIIKRLIKCYLVFEKEATAMTLVKHLETTGYGIRKMIQPNGLSKKIKIWAQNNRDWFNVGYYQNKQRVTVFYLKSKE